ncbi:MAG: YqaJ viral recombinase family protein [Candidatus Methanomethylophilaceae archaeon]|nr:YqaJ viral recombinase family protein [Candidatus Methanomethylophilaceae archaeon]
MAWAEVEDVDDDRRIVRFVPHKPKKITGSRIAAIVGQNEYASEFKVACDIIGLYREPETKFTIAGNVMEPKIREYLRRNADRYIGTALGEGKLDVIDPVPKEECGYEHFPNAAPFGGMVDGWVDLDGKHTAVLEIKTASDREKWFDGEKEIVPSNYVMQTSLYCDLSGLDRIVFAVAFPEEPDYDDPESWEPNEDNVIVRVVEPVPMKDYKSQALAWYDKYIKKGITPPWTMDDTFIVDDILKNCGY